MRAWRGKWKFRQQSLYTGIIMGVLAMCLALFGLDAWHTWQERYIVLAEDKDETANLARSLAQHAHDLVETADVVLLGLVDRISTDGLQPEALARLERQLSKQAAALPAIKRIFVLDADGAMIASSATRRPSPAQNTSPSFAYHRDHRTSALYLTEPVKSGTDGEWVLRLSRRIETPDGRFGGVVLASISIDYINAFYSMLSVGEQGIVSLVTTTGHVVARSPSKPDPTGADLSGGHVFHDLLPHAPNGSFRTRSILDGTELLGSYRQVQSYPLVVVVAHGYDEVMADWWWEARRHMAVTATIAAALVFAGFRVAGQIRSRQQAELRYRLLADNSTDAIVSLGVDGRRLYVSPAFETLTGWGPEDSMGPDWTRIVHAHDHDLIRQMLRKFRDGATNLTTEFRYICKNGNYLWVEARSSMASATEGETAQIVSVIRDITSRKASDIRLAALNQRLATQANTDQLTNLANRRRFDEALEQERLRSARDQTPLSLLLLDVDRFKLYNDRYGHQAGDRCLAAVAAALRACGRRPGDLVARYGGEEFAILLPGTPADGAMQRAEAIRTAVHTLGIEHDGNSPIGVVTASLGVSTCYPSAEGSPLNSDRIIAMADEGLYAAKRTGRNKVVHHAEIPPAHPAPVDERQRLATFAKFQAAAPTGTRETLDRLARLTATLFQTPVALVSLVGQDTQCFVGRSGLDVDGTPRDVSFCSHTIAYRDVFTIVDANEDLRFAQNPLVTGEPGIRFYAGAPIMAKNGDAVGALCIIDFTPRPHLTTAQKALLANLAALAADHLSERSQAQA